MNTQAAPVEKDPVCGMTVDPARAKATHEHAGKTYYFCCAGCQAEIQADPAKYLNRLQDPVRKRSSASRRCLRVPYKLRLFAVRAPARDVPVAAAKTPAAPPQGFAKRIHLPDGSRSSPAGSRRLPEVRDGA